MFDIRGVIQVGSKHYSMKHEPLVLSNIVLGLACRSLTFLHGTIHPETEGRAIGQYVFWFEDGSSEIFPIHYGRHSFDWHKAPGSHLDKLTDSRLIWKGANATGPEGPKAVHLYATRWTNPHPERAIRQMSLVSLKTQSAPFLVAITAEVFGVNGE